MNLWMLLLLNLWRLCSSVIQARMNETGGEGLDVDLCDFVRKSWTYASITSLFGRHLLGIWPDIYEDYWECDSKIQ